MSISSREAAEIAAANQSDRRPVVFVHGLWLLPTSWDPWRELFEQRGYATLAVDWPRDPVSVEEARRDPDAFAGTGVGEVADHVAEVIGRLDRKPIVIGHSFGGLLAQNIAGRGLGVAAVAVAPAPTRGVLPLPFSALKSASPVLRNPLNMKRAVPLTYEQFRYGFANAVPEDEARELYDAFHVAAAGRPLFQAATANLDPHTEAQADAKNPERGPMLVISGEKDHIVPWRLANAAYRKQRHNPADTEIVELPGRGHSLVIDHGWPGVAEAALTFLGQHGAAA